jgi:hypothetical protein
VTDLTFTRSGEFAVTQIEANTEEGTDFVDAWLLGTMEVLDSGRIIVPTEVAPEVEMSALKQGLTINHETRP